MKNFISRNISWLFSLGFLFIYFAQTLFARNSFLQALSWVLAGICFLGTPILYRLQTRDEYPDELKKTLFWGFATGYIALLFYFIQSDWLLAKIAYAPEYEENRESLQKLLTVTRSVFFLALAGHVFLTIMVQSGLKALKAEAARNRFVRQTAAQAILFLSIIVAAMFAANKRPFTLDMTDFHRFSLSPEGRRIVQQINRPVKITAFYPFFDSIQRSVEPMLADMKSVNSLLEYRIVDPYRDKEIADEKKVNSKGVVLFESIDENEVDIDKRERRKMVFITGKADLKKMEREFVSALVSVTEKKKKVCMTTGHGEFGPTAAFAGERGSRFEEALKSSNFEVDKISPRNGFPPKVPEDCEAVVIPGLRSAFSLAEQKALLTYQKNGGGIFVLLDPASAGNPEFLVNEFDLIYKKGPVLSSIAAKGEPSVVIAVDYSSSPITSDFTKLPERARFSVFPGTGYFEKKKPSENLKSTKVQKDKQAKDKIEIDFFVRTAFRSWVDLIPNKIQDIKKEPSKAYQIAVAASKEKKRLVAFADSDFINDRFISAGINLPLAVGSVQWLVENEKVRGIVSSKWSEKRVSLTPAQDDFVFYFLSFLWPLMIFSGGMLYVRRVRRRRGQLS